MNRVSFTRMDAGTPTDFALLLRNERAEKDGLAGHLLTLLHSLREGDTGYQVNRFEHSLQTATRALRDGAEEDLIICALFHDAGDILAPDNHAALAASLLAPYVSERAAWIVANHGAFQGYYYFHHWGRDRHAREVHRGHRWFSDAEHFCAAWDQVSFDPDYDTEELATFEPMIQRVFSRDAWSQGTP